VFFEVLHEIRDRKSSIHLDLQVASGLRAREHVARQVGREDADAPIVERREVFGQQHRERIWLLTGRRRRAPDREFAPGAARGHQAGNYFRSQQVERRSIPEEGRLVRRHRLDHVSAHRLVVTLQPL
jgi:hypothetical protein